MWRNSDCIGLPGDQAAKSINQRIATVVSSTPNPALQIGGFGLTRTPQMPLVENFALIMLRNWSCNFKITFLGNFGGIEVSLDTGMETYLVDREPVFSK